MRKLRFRQLMAALGVTAALCGVVFAMFLFVRGTRTALEAEDRFHAAILIHSAIRQFEAHHERRPEGPKYLTTIDPLESGGMTWPGDESRILELVIVDWTALQSSEPASNALRPSGAVYEGWESILIESHQ